MGPYEITAPLGAGGMGEVYKCRDTRLNRFVAVKVLPPGRVADATRKQRFIQEAKAASALNHTNIITIHDIAIDSGRDYIVMEYVPGKTLDALIPRAGMRLDELLKIAIQVAEGLSAAHAADIIHRDIKPSNIMVSVSGLVKILDFGVAKLNERGEVTEDDATLTLQLKTDAGTVMGTAAYMSPEQAEGKTVDARSDIFSFGAVLYEMATGHRAFPGESRAATIAAVLNQEPKPLHAAAPDLPNEFERIILRCLRKDPDKRQQHMSDVKVLLQELKDESESGKLATTLASKTSRRRWRRVGAGAAIAVLASAAGLWLTRNRDNQLLPRVVPLTTFAGSEDHPSFSPDGNQVVFSWNGERQDNVDLYVKMLGSPTALRLTTDAGVDRYPSWSRDGRQIAFLKSASQGTAIYLISPLGGPEQKIVEFDAAQGAPAWSPDGTFLIVAKAYREERPGDGAGALFLVPVQGGEPRPILVPTPGRWYIFPAYAPAGRSLAFASCRGSPGAPFCDVLLVDLSANLLPLGKPRQLASAPAVNGLAWNADGRSLIYGAGERTASYLWSLDVAGGGSPKRLEIASQGAYCPAVAPKGNRLAFSRVISDIDIWRLEVGGKPQPLLVSSMLDASPHFSPDGRRIVFASDRGLNGIAIWLANADGTGLMQLTRGPEDYHGSPRWSPDGRWIAFDARGQDGRWNIKLVESGGGQPRQVTGGPFSSVVPTWSADGKGIYFASDRTGRFEIWRVPAGGGAAVQVTRNGGYMGLESPDGGTLYYTKTSGIGPLYLRLLDAGEEKEVLEHVPVRGFAVFQDGIYYFDYLNFGGPQKYALRFHEFATGHSRIIGQFEGLASIALAVSPERTTFLFGWQTSVGRDLMLIENFR